MRKGMFGKLAIVAMALVAGICMATPMAFAADDEHAAGASESSGGSAGLGIGIGVGLAVGLTGLGTGLAQSSVGAGGTGAMAERPELFGQVLVLFAIPETIVVLGFALGYLLMGNL